MILMLSGLFVYSSLTTTTTAATETDPAKKIYNKTEHLHYAYQHNGQSNKIKCYDDTIYLFIVIKYREKKPSEFFVSVDIFNEMESLTKIDSVYS